MENRKSFPDINQAKDAGNQLGKVGGKSRAGNAQRNDQNKSQVKNDIEKGRNDQKDQRCFAVSKGADYTG